MPLLTRDFMEAVLSVVLSVLYEIAGPAVRGLRKRGASGLVNDLRAELSSDSNASHKLALRAHDELVKSGIKQRDLIDLMSFVQSDSGRVLIRLVAIQALTTASEDPEVTGALEIQCSALLRLHYRRKVEDADFYSKVLVQTIGESVRIVFSALSKKDSDSAKLIRSQALEQNQMRELLLAANLRHRATQIDALFPLLPSDIEAEIQRYAHLLHEDTLRISIATVGKELSVPLSDCLVIPDFQPRDDQPRTMPLVPDNGDLAVGSLILAHNRMVLLGDPGGGKSTAIQALMHELSGRILENETDAVPFRVVLRHFATAFRSDSKVGLFTFLLGSINDDLNADMSAATLRYLLHTGRAVVLFDGLDEILSVDLRKQVIDRITRFCGAFSPSAFICTSREVGYDEYPLHAGFAETLILPFTDAKTRQFADNFFEFLGENTVRRVGLREFMEQTAKIPDIRSNPLMLGVLCNLFASGRTMPSNRVDLYSKCAQMLFEEWDASRGIPMSVTNQHAAEQAVNELALQMFQEGREEIAEFELISTLSAFFSREIGASAIEARQSAESTLRLWRGRKWILIFAGTEEGVDYFRFSHRTFLEFFAAQQAVYVSKDGSALWNLLKPLFENRTGVVFCLLSIQMLSERTRGAADEFLLKASEYVDSINVSDPRKAFNVILTAVEAIASSRVDSQTRQQIVETAIEVFVPLIPYSDSLGIFSGSGLGFIDVFDGTEIDPELNLSEELSGVFSDASEHAAVTIEDASALLRELQHLGALDRTRAIEKIESKVAEGLRHDHKQVWLRFAMTFVDLPHFDGWRTVSKEWKVELEESAIKLWERVRSMEVTIADLDETDFWLATTLIRSRATSDPSLLNWIGAEGLFVGGSPFPVVRHAMPTAAHSVFIALLGLSHKQLRSNWNEPQLSALSTAITKLLVSVPDETTQQVGPGLGDFSVLAGPEDLEIGQPFKLDPAALVTTLLLAADIAAYKDNKFLQAAVALLPKDEIYQRTGRLVQAIMYDGDWYNSQSESDIDALFGDDKIKELLQEYGGNA